jgi:putative ABC transport system ATP-binding protein
MIRLTGIRKSYQAGVQAVAALDGIDLDILANEYVAITGTSGSGKSTLLNIIGCLDIPSAGQYLLNGHDVSRMTDDQLAEVRNAGIGFIFQSFHLLPRASALDNVAQPLIYRGMRAEERRWRAAAALYQVGLGERLHHRPNQLSGGQRQRVAIARALVGRPAILLADEPTGNLDSATSRDIMALFEELHRSGHTIVLVTHEPEIAAFSRRVIRLKDGKLHSDFIINPERALVAAR